MHSYVTLNVPLYVSYISHSPTRIPWRHFDLSSDLRLTFVYDTAKMWTDGIGTPPEAELPGTFGNPGPRWLNCLCRNLLPDLDEDPARWLFGRPFQNRRPIQRHVCLEPPRKVYNFMSIHPIIKSMPFIIEPAFEIVTTRIWRFHLMHTFSHFISSL